MPMPRAVWPLLSPGLIRPGLVGDDHGAAVMEFALVAPLLIMLLLGVSDLVPATMARFKAGNATQSVADLTAQFPEMQTSDVVNVFAGGRVVLAPFSGSTLILRLTNVASDGNGNAFVYWSCGQDSLPPYPAKSAVTATPTGTSVDTLIWMKNVVSGSYVENGTNTSYVMVESSYVYDAPAKFVLKTPQIMTNVAYMLPRQSSYVGFPWNGDPNSAPTAPASATQTGSTTLSNGTVCNYAY